MRKIAVALVVVIVAVLSWQVLALNRRVKALDGVVFLRNSIDPKEYWGPPRDLREWASAKFDGYYTMASDTNADLRELWRAYLGHRCAEWHALYKGHGRPPGWTDEMDRRHPCRDD
jgi:hypothetical protein